jgi:hypothetical protein
MTNEQDSKSIRELGVDPETGKLVTVVQFEDRTRFSVLVGNNKDLDFKFRSLRIKERLKYRFDIITLSEALDILRLPRNLGQTSEGEDVVADDGNYGPSIRYGDKEYISLFSHTAEDITLDEALELIVIHKKKMAKKIKIKKAAGIQFDEKIKDKLYKSLVPDSGESESVQGELIRQYYSVTHEVHGNGSGNWVDYKYEVNLKGYSKEYFIELAKNYLNDNPKTLNESKTSEFFKKIQECENIDDIEDLSSDYIFSYDGSLIPDFSKCTTTQEQLNNAIYWDEYLNWMFVWLSNHPLSEWDQKYIDNLRRSFEIFRPEVPVGVISYESEEEWHHQNKGKMSTITGRDEMDAQSFIESSIYNWIYQNPDLVDLKGNNLNVNISDIFKATK